MAEHSDRSTDAALGLDPVLLEVVRCPVCKGELTVDPAARALVCAGCARGYPVRDGVPVLLADEAVAAPGGAEPGTSGRGGQA